MTIGHCCPALKSSSARTPGAVSCPVACLPTFVAADRLRGPSRGASLFPLRHSYAFSESNLSKIPRFVYVTCP